MGYTSLSWHVVKQNSLVLVLVVLQWELISRLMLFFRRKFASSHHLFFRLLLTLLASGLGGMLLATLVFEAPNWYVGKIYLSIALFGANFGPMFMLSALVIGAYKVVYNFYQLRKIEQEKELLQKAHLQSQLDSLKSQVNPHFLFNSLNSLLSLISSSPKEAEHFVEELSSVYRYLLHTNEKQVTTLRQEVAFIHSYFHLLKTRYGEGIVLQVNIAEALLEYGVSSLTLQLLLENAVKHNVISPARPLLIEIFSCAPAEVSTTAVWVTVRNNVQRKIQPVVSHQLGLNNIRLDVS